jgi:phenol 2-monooxygenase (NADPH)
MFCPDPNAEDVFELRGVNRETGCMVVVRPDQYVSHVLPLDAHEALTNFFARILIEPRRGPKGPSRREVQPARGTQDVMRATRAS